jgi:hypothetical protein
MFVALLGHFIAGAPAAIVATACVCEPTCFLAFGVSWALALPRRAPDDRDPGRAGVDHDRFSRVQRADYHARLRSRLERPRSHRRDVCARHPTWISPLVALAGAAALGLAGLVH